MTLHKQRGPETWVGVVLVVFTVAILVGSIYYSYTSPFNPRNIRYDLDDLKSRVDRLENK